ERIDISCHSKDGKHLVAFSKGDGSFTPAKWWPSAPGAGEGWCAEPARLEVGKFSRSKGQLSDFMCHTNDGKHAVAFNNGDGTFSPKAWWPSAPGAGEAWCARPARLTLGAISGDKKSGNRMNLVCHSPDSKHALAFTNADGTFTAQKWWPSELGAGGDAWCDIAHLDADPSALPAADLICRGDDGRVLIAKAQADGKFVSGAWQQPKWPE
ncbi:MAG TPA: hypothetical protein VKP30_14130, partial [Polyangiaceae bacterium]|nr:hypothetical protein [Polyangiaceae bacterium]